MTKVEEQAARWTAATAVLKRAGVRVEEAGGFLEVAIPIGRDIPAVRAALNVVGFGRAPWRFVPCPERPGAVLNREYISLVRPSILAFTNDLQAQVNQGGDVAAMWEWVEPRLRELDPTFLSDLRAWLLHSGEDE